MKATQLPDNTRIEWTNVGKTHTSGNEESFVKKFMSCEWKELLPEGSTEAMMPAMGINEAISQLRIPKVSHYMISNECAPYGFYGVRGHYKNADVDIFMIDAGDSISPIAMHVTDK